jgi:phospholipid transport system substrate-binding protein
MAQRGGRWAMGAVALALAFGTARAEAPNAGPPNVASIDDPCRFVDVALQDTLAVVTTTPLESGDVHDRLREVLKRYFDIAQLGRNTVGRAWTVVAPAQQAAFLATFENFLIAGYVGSLSGAGSASFAPSTLVNSATGLDGETMSHVRTELRSPQNPPHAILIAVSRPADGVNRITDVATEGVSLRTVLAADFGAFLRRNGNRLESLVDALQQKIAGRLDEH